ncbi:MAG TPA: response regulator [Bdellovibrionota bacterium]|jgi:two-component system chemotaxis response regulator CheY|nr:response regulator [Bdellovibrionota bacterium]
MANIAQLKFLVVDDMATMRTIVTQQLRGLGAAEITQATDGVNAWQALEAAKGSGPIQFIVSDWNMPNMPGIELLKKCRADSVYKGVAFMLLTAEAEASQVGEAVAAGVDNYLVKPFTPENFGEKFKAVMAKRFP